MFDVGAALKKRRREYCTTMLLQLLYFSTLEHLFFVHLFFH